MKKINKFSFFAIFVAVVMAFGGGLLLSNSVMPNVTLSHSQTVSEISQPKVDTAPAEEEVSAAAPEEEVGYGGIRYYYFEVENITGGPSLGCSVDLRVWCFKDQEWKYVTENDSSPVEAYLNDSEQSYIFISYSIYDGYELFGFWEGGYDVNISSGASEYYSPRGSYTVTFAMQISGEQKTVYFDANGGSGGDTWTVYYGARYDGVGGGGYYTYWPSASRTNWYFDGWYTSRTGGSLVENDSICYVSSSSQTLYAHWYCYIEGRPNDSNYGYVTGSGWYDEGDYCTLKAYNYSGYKFSYWSGGIDSTSYGFYVNGNDDIIAYFGPIDYTISYTLNGGSATNPSSYTIETENFTLNNPTRTGYTFAGWTGTGLSSATKNVTVSKGSTGNRTYAATWTANTYKVTLDQQNGTGGTASVTATYNSAMPKITTLPTKTGYTFAGYYDATSGGTQYYKADGTSAKNWNKTSATTLYARWTANTYKVTLDQQNGTGGTASVTATYNSAMPQITTLPSRAGYTFAGYYDATSGGTQYYKADGTSAKNWNKTSATTLYARWAGISYSVAFNGNESTGGSMTTQTGFVYGTEKALSSNAFERKYTATFDYDFDSNTTTDTAVYTFKNWNTQANGSGTSYSNGAKVSTLTTTSGGTVTLYAQWNPDTVTFPGAITRAGYNFLGWSETKGATTPTYTASQTLTINQAKTFYAVWELAETIINFSINGGDSASPIHPQTKVIYGNSMPALDDSIKPTKRGYTFDGYALNGVKYYNAKLESVQNWNVKEVEVTLDAQWMVNTYTISYKDQGGSEYSGVLGSLTTTHTYDTPTTLNDGIKTGYTLEGFYTDSACSGEKVTTIGATDYVNDFTLYAKWTANTYYISYNGNGATSGEMQNSTHVYDIQGNLSKNTYERKFDVTFDFNYEGKNDQTETVIATFNGWAKSETGDFVYADEEEVLNFTAVDGETIALFAKWTDGTITLQTPIRDSHDFMYWQVGSSQEFKQGGESYTPSENVTLTAIWKIKTYAITYFGNGNTSGEAPSQQTKEYGTDIQILNANTLEKIGHTFNGWNTQADGGGVQYDVDTFYTENATLNLYAVWTPINYTITYKDKDGNDGFSYDHEGTYPTGHTYGTETQLSNAVRTGYRFVGWFTESDCSGTPITTLDPTGYTAPITLYADWEAEEYDITYYNQGGSAFDGTFDENPPTKHIYDIDTPLVRPTKHGYDFLDWYLDINCPEGQEVTELSGTAFTDDIKLYAKWSIQRYTITLEKDYGIESITGAGTYDYDTPVQINATLKPGYTWVEWQKQNGTTHTTAQTFTFTIDIANVTFKAVSKIITYSITYNLDGGELTTVNPGTYTVLSNFPLNNPTKVGYDFEGWTYEAEQTPIKAMNIQPDDGLLTGDLSFVAHWTPRNDTQYKVNYYLENLENTSNILDTNNCELIDTLIGSGTTGVNIQADLKTFEGFKTPASETITILANGSAVHNYFFARESYTLTLNVGNGIVSVNGGGTYKYEEPITISAVLQDNYNWAQWTNEATNSIFTQNQNHTFNMPAYNLTLTATAVINSVKITFDDQGGFGGAGQAVYNYGAEMDDITSLPTKEGYDFQGYYTLANGGGAKYYDANGNTSESCHFTEDTTLYAYWTGKTYSVSYNSNLPEGFAGGNLSETSTDVVFGDAYPTLATWTSNPTKTAYNISFKGWFFESVGGTKISDTTIVEIADNHTVYAQWTVTPIDYTITFSSGEGYTITATKDGQNFLSGGVVNITDEVTFDITPNTGYKNAVLSASGEKRSFENNVLSNVYENITISGSATPIVYNIIYNYNLEEGDVSIANPNTYTILDEFTLNNPSKYGYDFIGWTGSNGDIPSLVVTVNKGTYGNLEYTANYQLTPAIAPIIATQPTDGITPYGESITLSVNVPSIDLHIITYQWYKDGIEIAGATENTFTTDSSIPAGEINEYYVKVTATREDNNLSASTDSDVVSVEIEYLDFENVDVQGAYDNIYTGEIRSIIATTTTADAKIEYSLNNALWQENTFNFINATDGPQTVYWRITKANYNTQTGSETINITQAPNGWVIAPNISGWIYGSPNTPTAQAKFGEVVFTYSIKGANDFSIELPNNANEYTMKAVVEETANFEGIETQVDFKIEQKEVGLIWDETSFTYDGTPKLPTAEATGLIDGDSCDVVVSGEQTEVSAIPYTATAVSLTNPNYKLPNEVTVKFSIYYERITGITVLSYTGVYDKQPHSVTIQGALAGDVISYSLDGDEYTTEEITRTDAGLTTLYIKVSRTNFADFVSEQVLIEITQATIEIPTADLRNFTYTGEVLTYEPQGFDSETMVISGNEQTSANETGYEVVVSIKDKTNYTWTDGDQRDITFVFVVAKLTPVVNSEPTFSDVYSGQRLEDVQILGGDVSVDGAFTWQYPTTILVNGENKVNIVFEPTDFANCNMLVYEVTVEASQITLTFDVNNDEIGMVSQSSIVVDYGTLLSISDHIILVGGTEITAVAKTFEDVFVTFTDWSGVTSGAIQGPMSITANFEISGIIASISATNYYNQNTNNIIGGGVEFDGITEQETQFAVGDEIKIIASPETGYSLKHWLVNGIETPSTSENTLILTAGEEGIEVVAVFVGNNVKLVLNAGDNANLQNTVGGNLDGDYYHVGDVIEVNVLPNEGYLFQNGWTHSLNGEIQGPTYTFTSEDAEAGQITLTAITFAEVITVDFEITSGGYAFVDSQTWDEENTSYTIEYTGDIQFGIFSYERYAFSSGSVKVDNGEAVNIVDYLTENNATIPNADFKRATTITISLNFAEQRWTDFVLQNMITTEGTDPDFTYKVMSEYEFEGDGTKKNPYKISSVSQFALLSFIINNNIVQENTEKTLYNTPETYYLVEGEYDFSERFWMPIGKQDAPFNAIINYEDKPTGIYLNNDSQNNIGVLFDEKVVEKYKGLFGYLGDDAKINPSNAEGKFLLWIIIGGALVVIAVAVIVPFVFGKKRSENMANKTTAVNSSRTQQIQNMRNRVRHEYDYDDDYDND